ncbi:YciI family protein [Streptomyces diastatochromogenes]|nr:YciI family protein [Streptomyces diastatochromogenes]
MPRYLLSIYQPDGPRPDAETMARVAGDLHRLNEELRESGSWVFTGGLHPPATATVVRADGMITDGPYVEGKEYVGGFWVIDAPDLDAALSWGRKAAAATTLPIEVRPFQDVEPY